MLIHNARVDRIIPDRTFAPNKSRPLQWIPYYYCQIFPSGRETKVTLNGLNLFFSPVVTQIV